MSPALVFISLGRVGLRIPRKGRHRDSLNLTHILFTCGRDHGGRALHLHSSDMVRTLLRQRAAPHGIAPWKARPPSSSMAKISHNKYSPDFVDIVNVCEICSAQPCNFLSSNLHSKKGRAFRVGRDLFIPHEFEKSRPLQEGQLSLFHTHYKYLFFFLTTPFPQLLSLRGDSTTI